MPDFPDPVVVRTVEENDKVHFDWQQPGWDKLLETVKTIRDNRLARPLGWGRAELEIPVGILHFLKKAIPELDSPDMGIKARAWKKFAASPLSLPFRVNQSGRALSRSFGGLPDGGQRTGRDSLPGGDLPKATADGLETDAGIRGRPDGVPVIE